MKQGTRLPQALFELSAQHDAFRVEKQIFMVRKKFRGKINKTLWLSQACVEDVTKTVLFNPVIPRLDFSYS